VGFLLEKISIQIIFDENGGGNHIMTVNGFRKSFGNVNGSFIKNNA